LKDYKDEDMEPNPYESPRAESGKSHGTRRVVLLAALLLLMLLTTFVLFSYLIKVRNAMGNQ
jgi:hypothetical protein